MLSHALPLMYTGQKQLSSNGARTDGLSINRGKGGFAKGRRAKMGRNQGYDNNARLPEIR